MFEGNGRQFEKDLREFHFHAIHSFSVDAEHSIAPGLFLWVMRPWNSGSIHFLFFYPVVIHDHFPIWSLTRCRHFSNLEVRNCSPREMLSRRPQIIKQRYLAVSYRSSNRPFYLLCFFDVPGVSLLLFYILTLIY